MVVGRDLCVRWAIGCVVGLVALLESQDTGNYGMLKEDGMGYQKVWTWVAVLLLASGCNLGGGQDETDEPIVVDTPADVGGQPSVVILSPEDGDEFVVDEQILFSVEATDVVGVTRVQLLANGQIVKTVSSETTTGDPDLDAVLDFTPRTTGDFAMSVIAFRGATASPPAEIGLIVRDEQADIENTPQTNPGLPQIPNDGVCRALVNVNLNMRSEPTTTRDNVIRVLPASTLAPITGRLGDNSWWELNVNGQTGWVSADFTTIYGNCQTVPVRNIQINTPIPSRTPTLTPTHTSTPTLTPTLTPTPVPGVPNLIVSNISGDEEVVIPADSSEVIVEYAVTITNVGAGPSGRFANELRFEDQIYNLSVVSDLAAGQSIIFTQEVTFDASYVGQDLIIRAEVDSNNEVTEISEADNLGLLEVSVTQAQ